jgi:predicted neuraminidase
MTSTFLYDKAPFPSCHASTIVEPEPGRLLAAWFGGTREGANDVKIWLARHDGTRWSEPEVAAQEPGFPCWNPVLFRSRSGTLFLFYKAGPSPMTWSGFVRRSADGGKTWSPPELLPAGLLGPIKNKPLQRTDGTILAGTSVESHRAWACWVERSTDDGRTWRRFGPITLPGHPFGIIQPALFEAKDGRIVMLCRARGVGVICQAESRDNGETWTPAAKTELPHPNSGIDLVRTGEGRMFLVYNHTTRGRTPLNLALSTDDGRTWAMVHTLEDQPGEYSYPAIIQTQDGRLHLTYTWKRERIKHVVLDPMQFKAKP